MVAVIVLLGTFLKIQTVQIVPNAELATKVNSVRKEPVRVCDVTPAHFNPNPARAQIAPLDNTKTAKVKKIVKNVMSIRI